MKCAAQNVRSSAAWRVALAARLTGSLFVGSSAIRFRLDWTPKFPMEAGSAAAVVST